MGGTADAPPPPPPSGHSCSWRELSQRFSWFCLKPLSPPGKRDQADILVRHPKVGDTLVPPFFRARAGATRTGAGSIVPTTAVTVTNAGHDHQRQGWHESAAHIVLPSTRLTVPRNRLRQTCLCAAPVRCGCLTYKPVGGSKGWGVGEGKTKGIFPRRKTSPKLQANGLAAHQSRAVRQLGQFWLYLSAGGSSPAVHSPHPTPPRRGGCSSCQHHSGETYVCVRTAEQKKTVPRNLTVTEVLT